MAFVTDFTCRHCHQTKTEVVVPSRICTSCRQGIEKAEEEAHLAKLALKPLDQRIAEIERQLWRLDADARLKALEAMNARY
jgi:hypothetical protein